MMVPKNYTEPKSKPMTQFHTSVSPGLAVKIRAAVAADHDRSISKWIAIQLEKVFAKTTRVKK